MGESRARSGRLGLFLALGAALLLGVAFLLRGGGARGGDGADTGAARAGRNATELVPTEAFEREPLTEPRAHEPAEADETSVANPARPEEPAVAQLRVTGRVVDEQGVPLEGAELRSRAQGGWRTLARSDAGGFLAGTLARAGWVRFEVLADGHARAERELRGPAGDALELGTIVLAPGGALRGRVLADGGGAAAQAYVQVAPARELPAEGGRASGAEARERMGEVQALVDGAVADDGSFLLRGVAPGEFVLLASGPGGIAWTPTFRLEAGDVLERELVLPRADESAWIGGRVLDPQGEPLAGVTVRLWSGEEGGLDGLGYSGLHGHEISADDGRFCFELETPGVFNLHARDPRLRGAHLARPAVASGQRALELVLSHVPEVEVRLVDERGQPIAWGNVWARGGDSPVPLTPLGERGVGRIPFAGSKLTLEADAPGFARSKCGPYRPEDVRDGLAIVLVPGGFLRGRLMSGGRPVRGARLDLCPSRELDGPLPSRGVAPDGWPFALRGHVELVGQDGMSDGDGSFVLSVPSQDWHALRVEAEGFPLTIFGPYELDPAGVNPELTLELERGGTLEGLLLLPPGEGATGHFVGVSNGWDFAHTTAVDAQGRFRFANLAPGEYQVRPVTPPVASLQTLERCWGAQILAWESEAVVRSGTTTRFELDCTHERGHALVGRFAFDGADLAGWRATLALPASDGEIELASVPLGSDGAFRLVAARAGSHVLVIQSKEGSSFSRPVELVGAETSVDVTFACAWATVDLDLDPVLAWQLAHDAPDGTRFKAWTWAMSGSWRVAVPAGTLRSIVLRGSGEEWLESEPIELAPGEERALKPTAGPQEH